VRGSVFVSNNKIGRSLFLFEGAFFLGEHSFSWRAIALPCPHQSPDHAPENNETATLFGLGEKNILLLVLPKTFAAIG
jgi:hypothetical protein